MEREFERLLDAAKNDEEAGATARSQALSFVGRLVQMHTALMRRRLFPLLLLAAGCISEPEPLELGTRRPFALGMPGAVRAGVYAKDTITSVRCEGATCEQSSWGTWYATPHATTFDLHIDAVSENGSPLRYDGRQTAIEITWWVRSSGAAPDVAVLPGMKHRFYVSPTEDVVWNQQGGTITTAGSFTATDDDHMDTCFSTDVTAVGPGLGTVTFALAERSTVIAFECVSPMSATDVALAPFVKDGPPPHAFELRAAWTKEVVLDVEEERSFWVTFTTTDGRDRCRKCGACAPFCSCCLRADPSGSGDPNDRTTHAGRKEEGPLGADSASRRCCLRDRGGGPMKARLPLATALACLSAACELPWGDDGNNCQVSYTPTEATTVEGGTVTLKREEGEEQLAVGQSSSDSAVDVAGNVPAEWKEVDGGGFQPEGWVKSRVAVVHFSLTASPRATIVWCSDPYEKLVDRSNGVWCDGGTGSDAIVETFEVTVEEQRIAPDDVTYTVHGVAPSGAVVELIVHRRTIRVARYSGYAC